MSEKVKIGVAGLGRSGWTKHAVTPWTLKDQYEVVAVSDPLEEKRREAAEKFGCREYAAFQGLLDNEEVELVAVATPSHLHAQHTIAALEAGKAVVCEKPMAATLDEADGMIAAAKHAGKLLTVFQQRRYSPHFLKVREILDSGELGRIVEIRISEQAFVRRWDWQSLKGCGGGELRNNAPHLLDQALQLIKGTPRVFCDIQKTVTCGDAEDHVKVILKSDGEALVEVNVTFCCAYPDPLLLIMGTQGTLTGMEKSLRWKYFDPSQLPQHEPEPGPATGNYREEIPWREECWDVPSERKSDERLYYEDLYKALRQGAPLPITPESVRRVMWVIEECRRLSPI